MSTPASFVPAGCASALVTHRCLVVGAPGADLANGGVRVLAQVAAAGATVRIATRPLPDHALERDLFAFCPDLVLVSSPSGDSTRHRAAFAALHSVLAPLRVDGRGAELAGLRVLVCRDEHEAVASQLLTLADFTTRSPAQLLGFLGADATGPLVEGGPRISVVVRTKDRPGLLAEALASLAAGSYRRTEVVLVNDGGAPPVVPPDFPLPVVQVELAPNQGRAAAAQAGVEAATGDAVAFLDDDDLVAPEHVATLAGLISDDGVSVAYTDAAACVYELQDEAWTCRERRIPYSRDFDPDILAVDNYIPFNTIVIERKLFDQVGPFDVTLPFFEDWDYLIRLAAKTPFVHLQRVTCEYRHFRGATHQIFGEDPHKRADFLTVKGQVLDKHAGGRTGVSLARAVHTLRAEAVTAGEAAAKARRQGPAGAPVSRRDGADILRAARRRLGAALRVGSAPRIAPAVPHRNGTHPPHNAVALVCSEPIRPRMAGIGIRFIEMARRLSIQGLDVVLVSPGDPAEADGLALGDVSLVRFQPDRLRSLLDGRDAVVAQGPLADHVLRACLSVPTAIDLSDPWLVENLAYAPALGRGPFAADSASWALQMAHGDLFLCSSEEQRTFYLGFLAALGRVTPERVLVDPELRSLIAEVPLGVPTADELPAHRPCLPPRQPGERRLLFGTLYDWYDPWTVIEALTIVDRPDWTLLFVRTPNPATTPQTLLGLVEEHCRQLGWWGSRVQLIDWVPVDRRWDLFRDVDVVVSPHRPGVETRLSMRTRFLEAMAAGCPVVTSEGGAMSRLLTEHDAGWVTPPGDSSALAATLVDVLERPSVVAERQAGARALLARYHWDRVLQPVLDFCTKPHSDTTERRPPRATIGSTR